MRTLLVALATVVLSATAFTGVVMTANHPTAGTATATPIDPTVSTTWSAAPAGYPDCSRWGLSYATVAVSGVSTHYYGGCVNPAGLGTGDSFTGRLSGYLVAASHK